ncbi:hypothetical protein ACIPPM_22565 [Streptomyces sp. NPDC090119]|uniref:hypothetical protein n=1 Tax=Streptomyces sp. NPDC090119 TaxID=3365951 RepID=UPI003822AD73
MSDFTCFPPRTPLLPIVAPAGRRLRVSVVRHYAGDPTSGKECFSSEEHLSFAATRSIWMLRGSTPEQPIRSAETSGRRSTVVEWLPCRETGAAVVALFTAGKALSGRYFWCSDGLIVRDAGISNMTQVLTGPIENGEFM